MSTAGGSFLGLPAATVPPAAAPPPAIEIFHLDGCPHTAETIDLARAVAARVLPGAAVQPVRLEAEGFLARAIPGSPTVLVGGRDIAGREATPAGLIA